ncbi:MAG: methionine gamma-lyase [Prevotella sp.]|uniref:methionine gamma-lyase n=1 Tax=Prevotella sp. TaxID=59823 RepID=UPI002A2E1BA8|nr:methionine gamma-lyase [Prevotella sp.]MDD7319009.1 methionine gamma-lyase [Prevotellaceae bacterium]MDY4020789.1 methionine gamma-lyase [Prevotella sp.]
MLTTEEIVKSGFATRAVHVGAEKNMYGTLAAPIYQTSTFIFENAEQGGRRFALEEDGYIYTRLGNPTCTAVEQKVASLEGAEACVSASSGMGAITSAVWVCVQAGDHIVAGKTLYGCTYAFMEHGLKRYGVDVTFVDMRNTEEVEKAMRPNTKLVYVETPANPNMHIADIEAIAKIAHRQEGCRVMVDNTFCTPYLCRPLEFGADIVVHSATKFLNGHGDVIAGFVVGTKEYIDQVRLVGVKDLTGSVLGPFEAFLINRGMKTLHVRMDRHCENAQKVAEYLEKHPKVESIAYPGLKSFPQYDLAQKYMKKPGSMIAFEVKGGLEAGRTLINNVHLCSLAVSLGDTETLIEHPASMTHSPYTPEERAASNIPEGLVRLSVGLEDAEDIIADLERAFEKI